MKTIARRSPRPDSPLITIQDLVRIKEAMSRSDRKWKSHVFYPLVGSTPMTAVVPEDTSIRPHFRFQQAGPPGPRVHGGEGVVHELVKYEISLSRCLRLPIYGKPHRFAFSAMAAEHRVPVRGINYYVDLIGSFAEPAELAKDFNNCLVIEICDTHPIDEEKRNDLRAVNLATIEVSLPRGLHVRNDVELTGGDIQAKRAEIREFLADIGTAHVRMKHHPCYRIHSARMAAETAKAAAAKPSRKMPEKPDRVPSQTVSLPPPESTVIPITTPAPTASPEQTLGKREDSMSSVQEPAPVPFGHAETSLFVRFMSRLRSIWSD